MKTKIEVNGFEIEIDQSEEGTVNIKVERDEEVVEELTLDSSEYENEDSEILDNDEEIKTFDEYEDEDIEDEDIEDEDIEDEDIEDEDIEDEDIEDEDIEDEGGDRTLESFDSFLKK